MDCQCVEWRENLPKINGPIMLQSARSGGAYQHSGVPFRFCPWCGALLKDKEHHDLYAGDESLGEPDDVKSRLVQATSLTTVMQSAIEANCKIRIRGKGHVSIVDKGWVIADYSYHGDDQWLRHNGKPYLDDGDTFLVSAPDLK